MTGADELQNCDACGIKEGVDAPGCECVNPLVIVYANYSAWMEETTAPQTYSAFSTERGQQVTSRA